MSQPIAASIRRPVSVGYVVCFEPCVHPSQAAACARVVGQRCGVAVHRIFTGGPLLGFSIKGHLQTPALKRLVNDALVACVEPDLCLFWANESEIPMLSLSSILGALSSTNCSAFIGRVTSALEAKPCPACVTSQQTRLPTLTFDLDGATLSMLLRSGKLRIGARI